MFSPPSDTCENDDCPSGPDAQPWFCVSCCSVLCDSCWAKERAHKPGRVGQDGLPHEKTSQEVHARLKAVFSQTEQKTELLKLHIEDEETLWFAIEKGENDKCRFTDQGRFNQIMLMTKQPISGPRCPLLVSFVGQTGAGKSTLIKMLVSLKESNLNVARDEFFKSPISGSRKDDKSPTSGDVHLYVDPQSAFSEFPMLYADCEGLEGGETPPQAKTIKERITKAVKGDASNIREMKFPADMGKLGTREWAVRNVYPRLLYTFSDVVVFVLKNTRTFESVALQLLLEWAEKSMESSVNQASRPQIVIVLNDCDPAMDDDEWEVDAATRNLLESTQVKYAIHNNTQLKQYCEYWAQRGTTIHTTRQLLQCYYNGIHVVRIPTKGRDMQMKLQIDKLHTTLMKACNDSIEAKLAARRFCTTEELDRYLQAAFDHFAATPEQPFNFIEVALKANPIPQSFADHIIALAMGSSNVAHFAPAGDPLRPLTKLSSMIASYIALDCVRYSRPGRPADLFNRHYAESCVGAIDKFHEIFLPCSFIGKKGATCSNRMKSHEKGHQDESGYMIGTGGFQTSFNIEQNRKHWLHVIHTSLILLDSQIDKAHTESEFSSRNRHITIYEMHRRCLSKTFANGPTGLSGGHTCYACLMEIAQHPLPCGHMLCTECVKMLGKQTDKNTFTVETCPFEKGGEPCSIRFKPSFAGVRVLSLDGGGIRGIVELESLRAIQGILGPDLPVQEFFDLIVGTSTGGIIALGLGVKQWSVDQCTDRFVRLCAQAFIPKTYNKLFPQRLGSWLAIKYPRYKTRPLHKVLQEQFGDDPLYGKVPNDNVVRDTKVCVTTTPASAERAVIVGNYARQSEDDHWYRYRRGDFLKTWQAAAATSAAPGYFRMLNLILSGRITSAGYSTEVEFMDGALYFNNPVRVASNERRFLWPDVADTPPDILLSLGTGQNASAITTTIREDPVIRPSRTGAYCLPESKFMQLTKGLLARTDKPKSKVKNMVGALCNMMDSILDAEREYKIFDYEHNHKDNSGRVIRLNPDLASDPPRLDDVDRLLPLQALVAKKLKTPEYELSVERIAFRLIASSFHFEKVETIEHNEVEGYYICRGRVACRFEGRSNDLKACIRNIGKFLHRQSTQHFKPFLTIFNDPTGEGSQKVTLIQPMIDSMINDAEFRIAEDIVIKVLDKMSPTMIAVNLLPSGITIPEAFPLSGFPRYLVTESASTASRLQKRAEILKTKIKKSELLVGESIYHLLHAAEIAEAAEAARVLEKAKMAERARKMAESEAAKRLVESEAAEEATDRDTDRASRASISSVTTDEPQLHDTTSPSSSRTSLNRTISNNSKELISFTDKLRAKGSGPNLSGPPETPGSRSPDLSRAQPASSPVRKISGPLRTRYRAGVSGKPTSYTQIHDDQLGEEDAALVQALLPRLAFSNTTIIDALELTDDKDH